MSEAKDPFEAWLENQDVEPLAPPPGTFHRISRSARRIRWAKSAGAGLTVLLLVFGLTTVVRLGVLTNSQDIAEDATTTGQPWSEPTESATTRADASPGVGQSPLRGSSSAPSTGSARCRSGQLRVELGDGEGSAGHRWMDLVFTNTSSQTCTMYGYPGVSFVTGESGQQVNDPATRGSQNTPALVTLAPGLTALAKLGLVNADMYGGSDTCKPVTVTGFRVYPPDETAAVFVAFPTQACSVKGTGTAEINPVRAR